MDKLEKKIKIAFFLPSLEGGGTERNTVNLINGLSKRNFEISLILGYIKGPFVKEVSKEISVINLNTQHFYLLLFKFIKYFRKESPDIFVSAFPHINIISIIAKSFARVKTKLVLGERTTISCLTDSARTFFGRLIAYFLPYFIRFFYPRADKIVCVSKGVAEDLSKIINLPNKIIVIYNPVISDRIYRLTKEKVFHPWFLDKKTPTILAVGRLIKAKDYPTLLRAFNLVSQKKIIHLVILGKGEEKERIELLGQKLEISKDIVFLGFQKNPYKYMSKASVFVLSSSREGFPSTLIEAMACGVPVVSTDCQSGPNEIIKNGKNGILVSVGDWKSLAEAILKLLNDSNLRKELLYEAKKETKDFLIEKSVLEYDKLFKEIIN